MAKERGLARVAQGTGAATIRGRREVDGDEHQNENGDAAAAPRLNAPGLGLGPRQRPLGRGLQLQEPGEEETAEEHEYNLQHDKPSKALTRSEAPPPTPIDALPVTAQAPPIPLPRRSPNPHPAPKRFVLKFKKQLLEKAQHKEAEERSKVEGLLAGQRENAVCVSGFVREADLKMVPSLEGALGARRGGGRLREKERGELRGREGSVNGVHNEIRNGVGSAGSGGERERGLRNAGRKGREREREEKINGVHKEDADGLAVSGLQHYAPAGAVITKPAKSKKMELELRIDDGSKDKDKETLERNIDHIIFGDVTFKAWYPSWYPKEIIGEKALTVGAGGIVVTELYVCKRCFGYGKVLVEWVRHCKCCEREVPGRKVYVHGGWREEGVQLRGQGEWSVWEVDGGVETLFCQNLSLFAKLFLDNKSVFFDVSGFNYFLLVYTPPINSPHIIPGHPPHPQIIGFFSKEKMSWDNNNLACILVFPPWQRKGLGALLMGVSYAIARRECIMGGPEKPISDLGKKGYKRFWGAEIARWILSRPDGKKGKGGRPKREEVGVDVCSKETWIAPEDCLAVLRDMGVVERIGRGRGSVGGGDGNAEGGSGGGVGGGEVKEKEKIKVRIDKEAVRKWCERERIRLERVVGEEGFLPGYAERVQDGDEGEDVEGVEGEVEVELGD